MPCSRFFHIANVSMSLTRHPQVPLLACCSRSRHGNLFPSPSIFMPADFFRFNNMARPVSLSPTRDSVTAQCVSSYILHPLQTVRIALTGSCRSIRGTPTTGPHLDTSRLACPCRSTRVGRDSIVKPGAGIGLRLKDYPLVGSQRT